MEAPDNDIPIYRVNLCVCVCVYGGVTVLFKPFLERVKNLQEEYLRCTMSNAGK